MYRIKGEDPTETSFYAAGKLHNGRDLSIVESEESLSPLLSDEEVQEEIEIVNESFIDNYIQ